MKDKASIFVVVLLVLVGGYFYFNGVPKVSSDEVSGVVTSVTLDQIAFDGPALVNIETESMETKTIAIPSMGLPLCAAFENISDVSKIAVGDRISVLGETDEDGNIVPCTDASHYLKVTSVVMDQTIGFKFDYRKGPNGYVVVENTEKTDPNFFSGVNLFNQKEYEEFLRATDAREGPTAIGLRIYENPEKLWPAVWVERKPLESNIGLIVGEVREAVVGGANAVSFTVNGLFPIETYAVADDNKIFLLTVMYNDKETGIYKDFQEILKSFEFIKTEAQG